VHGEADGACKFLIVQGVGVCDFVVVGGRVSRAGTTTYATGRPAATAEVSAGTGWLFHPILDFANGGTSTFFIKVATGHAASTVRVVPKAALELLASMCAVFPAGCRAFEPRPATASNGSGAQNLTETSPLRAGCARVARWIVGIECQISPNRSRAQQLQRVGAQVFWL
jgi:hypothetical protein